MKVGASQKEIIGATSRLHVYSRIPAFFYNRHLMIRVLIHSACSEAIFLLIEQHGAKRICRSIFRTPVPVNYLRKLGRLHFW